MTSFFPDLNVWFALSVEGHFHGLTAWRWLNMLPPETKLIFCRHTHLGLIRLLTSGAAMGTRVMTSAGAMDVYEGWLNDPRVEFYPEPRDLSAAFRVAMDPFKKASASKMVSDCYLLAFSREAGSPLATFDEALWRVGKKRGYEVIQPG